MGDGLSSRPASIGLLEGQLDNVVNDMTNFQNPVDKPNPEDLRPLLRVSPPTPVGPVTGRYSVRIKRASLKQPFGVAFQAEDDVISIAEDLPHLGLRRFDQLVTVNAVRPDSVKECKRILADSATLELVLQHREAFGDAPGPPSRAVPVLSCWTCSALTNADVVVSTRENPVQGFGDVGCCVPLIPVIRGRNTISTQNQLPMRTLLSVTPIRVLDEFNGEYEIMMQRASLKQRFGVSFTAEQVQKNRGDTPSKRIVASEDMLHIGLRKGDQLLVINNIAPSVGTECRQILERSMSVHMKLRRDMQRYATTPASILEPVEELLECWEDLDRIPAGDVTADKRMCTPMLMCRYERAGTGSAEALPDSA